MRAARRRFWLHNGGLPAFMTGLALVLTGAGWTLPVAATGAVAVLLGLVLFAANVLVHAKPQRPGAVTTRRTPERFVARVEPAASPARHAPAPKAATPDA